MSLFDIEKLPATSAEAIRIFDERYLAALSAAPPGSWARDFGDAMDVDSPKVTFPISLLSTKYLETVGDSRFKGMDEVSFDVKTKEFDTGYEAFLLDLQKNIYAYKKWAQVPSRFVLAEGRHITKSIAALLEDGENQDCWDGADFFDTAHNANGKDAAQGQYSNYQSSSADPFDLTDLEAEVTAMRGVLDENGDKLGVEPDTILLPTGQYQKTFNKLALQNIVEDSNAGVTNPFFGKFKLIHVPEFTNDKDWYLVDSKLIKSQAMAPWTVLRYAVPGSLGLRTFDESSDFFKSTGKIKVSSHVWYGFSLVMPHAIRKIDGGS